MLVRVFSVIIAKLGGMAEDRLGNILVLLGIHNAYESRLRHPGR